MMNIIKQGLITLLVSFAVFFFIPVYSYAFTFSEYNFPINDASIACSYSSGNTYTYHWNMPYFYVCRYSQNGLFVYDLSSNSDFEEYLDSELRYSSSISTTSYNEMRYFTRSNNNYSGGVSQVWNMPDLRDFYSSLDSSLTANQKQRKIAELIYNNGGIPSEYWPSEPASPSSLGYIKNVNYSHNNNTSSQGMYEIVSWGSTSTTGIDLTEKINGYDRYRVEFALRDQSTIAKNSFYNGFQSNQDILDEWERTKPDPVLPFDINSIVSRLAGGLAGGLAEHVYPYGGTNRAIKQGLITTAPSFNKMISMGDTPASNRRYAFNALHEYTSSSNFATEAPEIHSSLTGVYNTNLPNFLKGGWFESIVSNSNYYNIADYHLSYNIYARIVDTKDKVNGNWLLIDKHGNPIGAEDDRMNGGYTSKPIKLPDFNPGTDWTDAPDDVDVPDDEIEDNDTVKDEPLGTGYDDGSDNSGSGTTNIYNNYTYNYDNRSWIENHYDNETVQDANEGIDWLKLFSGFFSIFLILFGPFLPEWAVVLVTVATPIILGLAIFKVIKGIIPFV